jgi:hypothetical protein
MSSGKITPLLIRGKPKNRTLKIGGHRGNGFGNGHGIRWRDRINAPAAK